MAINRHRGTAAAVKAVVAAYGAKFAMTEWWQTIRIVLGIAAGVGVISMIYKVVFEMGEEE